jgi:transmembrane sensor
MNPRPHTEESICEQAARWALLVERGGQETHAAFATWLRASPHHVREYLLITALNKELDEIDLENLNVDEILARPTSNITTLDSVLTRGDCGSSRQNHTRRARVSWLSGLAVGAVCLVVAGWWLLFGPASSQNYSTAIGEERSFSLADGSVVHLSPVSRLRVNFSAASREIQLDQGEAVFKVEHDPTRPFRVHAGGALIEDVGTEFHVYRRPTSTVVSVLEGAVEISGESTPSGPPVTFEPSISGGITSARQAAKSPTRRARVAAGEEARIAADGQILQRTAVPAEELNGWLQPRLIFSGDTLAEIAEDFNRYNRDPQIQIEGDVLRAKRFSGSFDAHDPQSLVDYLQQSVGGGISVERSGRMLVVRAR